MVEVREFVSDLLSGEGEHTPGVKDKKRKPLFGGGKGGSRVDPDGVAPRVISLHPIFTLSTLN